MDEFYSDNFFDGNAPIGWSERDWFDYLKKSEREISKFASVYSVNRLRGKSLEEIATIAGWPIPKFDDEYFEESDAEFSDEPWTLLNHPVYIITRGLMRCLQEHLGRVIAETLISPILVWDISKTIGETSRTTHQT